MQTISVPAAIESGSWSAVHPITPHDQAVMTGLRAFVAPNKGKLRGTGARVPFDGIISHTAAPDRVTFRRDAVGGLAGWWCEPAEALADAAILHFHGGWFNWGTAEAYRNLVGHIARSAGVNTFVPDYRLAPEHPFPAAVNDARAGFEGLVGRGIRTIALTGDSAGGNLVLTLLPQLSAHDVRPVGAVVLSPVTDLAMTGQSWRSRAEADPYFVPDQVESLIDAYLNGHDPADPLASPLYGDVAGLPPIRVHVGDAEVLLDDSLRYVARAAAAGVDAKVEVWEGMPHGFVGAVGQMQAAAESLEAVGGFLSARFELALHRERLSA